MRRVIARPRPPGASGFVEKNGSKIRSRSASGTPGPSSSTRELGRRRRAARRAAAPRPPRGVASSAFSTRFSSTWRSASVGSATGGSVVRERQLDRDAEIGRAVRDELGHRLAARGRARRSRRRAAATAGRACASTTSSSRSMRRSSSDRDLAEASPELGLAARSGEELEERLDRDERVPDLVHDLGDELAERGEPVERAAPRRRAARAARGRRGGGGRRGRAAAAPSAASVRGPHRARRGPCSRRPAAPPAGAPAPARSGAAAEKPCSVASASSATAPPAAPRSVGPASAPSAVHASSVGGGSCAPSTRAGEHLERAARVAPPRGAALRAGGVAERSESAREHRGEIRRRRVRSDAGLGTALVSSCFARERRDAFSLHGELLNAPGGALSNSALFLRSLRSLRARRTAALAVATSKEVAAPLAARPPDLASARSARCARHRSGGAC